MTEDAKKLHCLVKDRDLYLKNMSNKLEKEKKETLSSLSQIRARHSSIRMSKHEEKEKERKTLSRTLMANLVSATDFPDSPSYVPHMINVLKNILGNLNDIRRKKSFVVLYYTAKNGCCRIRIGIVHI